MSIRMFRDRSEDELEARLRRSRPTPRAEFSDQLLSRIQPREERPGSLRFVVAVAMTVGAFSVFGAFGGIGYAAKAVSATAHGIASVATPSSGLQTNGNGHGHGPTTTNGQSGTNENGGNGRNSGSNSANNTSNTSNTNSANGNGPGPPSGPGNQCPPGTHGEPAGSTNCVANGAGAGNCGQNQSGNTGQGAGNGGNDNGTGNSDACSPSGNQYGGKTTICHRTESDTNPFVLITVDNSALPAHKAHGDTLPNPDGSCPGPEIVL